MRNIVLFTLLFGIQCNAQNENINHNKKKINLVLDEKGSWYFVIFTGDKPLLSDSVYLNKSINFIAIDSITNYEKITIVNKMGYDLTDSMKLIRYTEHGNYKILKFYFPSESESKTIVFKDATKELFPVELKGQEQLDSIIESLSHSALNNH